MDSRRFAVFILSHGRPDKVKTWKALDNAGYTGRRIILCDDEDPTLAEYQDRYGDAVRIFNKDDAAKTFDLMDQTGPRGVVVYARAAVQAVADTEQLTHWLVTDDDATYIGQHRYVENAKLMWKDCTDFDMLCEAFCDFLDETNTLTVCMGQGGDYIGGADNFQVLNPFTRRKAMNSFFCATERPVPFRGRLNEDVNMYIGEGNAGAICLTCFTVAIANQPTQRTSGGITEAYRELGTVRKSFYTVMITPAAVKIGSIANAQNGKQGTARAHHRIDWNSAVPKIIDPRHKKDTPQ